MPPLFSVIIPTYNREKPLIRAVSSVLSQTYENFEVLVMDDGSTDLTKTAIEKLEDPRIHYWWSQNTGGPAEPRNKGIENAKGEWICFLDADDYWLPKKLEEIAGWLDSACRYDIICHNLERVDVNSGLRRPLRYGPLSEQMYESLLLTGNRLAPSATVVRKSFLDQHNLRFNTSKQYVIVEDYDMWMHIARMGGHFLFLDRILGIYTVESDNLSQDEKRYWRNLHHLLHDHVFLHQSFEKNRDALWRQVRCSLNISEAKILMDRKRKVDSILKIVITFWQTPVAATAHCMRRIRAKIYNRP